MPHQYDFLKVISIFRACCKLFFKFKINDILMILEKECDYFFLFEQKSNIFYFIFVSVKTCLPSYAMLRHAHLLMLQ